MTTLTSELNLAQAQDDDDNADYLVSDLANSLGILDGLFSSSTGHNHGGSHQGGALQPLSITTAMLADNAVTTPKIAPSAVGTTQLADGAVTAAKIAAGAVGPEALFAGTVANPAVNYVVAAGIMYVFAQAALTVTLPAAATTNRPIEVWALSGTVTVVAASGSVFGGSINLSTGAVTNGSITTGDAITFKSDLTNWRAG